MRTGGTGIGSLISFYRYIYFNQPRLVTATGIGLILLVGLTHLWESPEHFKAAGYIGTSFLANFAGSVIAAVGIYRGASTWGWLLGAVISSISIVAYVVSRTLGLPDFEEAMGNWGNSAGSAAVIFEALFVMGYVSVVTGMNVAYPNERRWHD